MRPHQIPIDLVWQADRLMEDVFALRLAERLMADRVGEKACLSGQRGGRGRPPFTGVGSRNSTHRPDFLQKGDLG